MSAATDAAADVKLHHAVARPVGLVLLGIGVAMLICVSTGPLWMLIDPLGAPDLPEGAGARQVVGLVISGLVSCVLGGVLMAHGRRASAVPLGRREAILVVTLIWLACGLFGGLPFIFVEGPTPGSSGLTPADAFFEAVSGFTTTGATVVYDIEHMLSRPLLLWRALMQWLGGMGIVVLFVAIFPSIGVGAKHLYRSEVPGPVAGGLRPRIAETSTVLWRFYAAFTGAQIVLLWFFGMSWFEAICHAFTTMSTGGFSTLDSSIGGFDEARVGWWNSLGIEWTIVLFMLIAGVNFALYYGMVRFRSLRVFLRSTEFRVYLGLVAVSILTLWVVLWLDRPSWDAGFASFRSAVFMVATTITSTGYGTDGYVHYPPAGMAIMLLLMFVGGSAGSTAGGLKVARVVLLFKLSWGQLRKSFRPQVVHVVRMARKAVDSAVVLDVAAFVLIYFVCMAAGVLLVTATDGVSVPRAFGAMLTSLSNMGPGPFHNVGVSGFESEPIDNFSGYSSVAKYVFSLAMILGRLEFFTLLALLLPDFWKR